MTTIRRLDRSLASGLAVLAVLSCTLALPALGQVPGRVNFQGLLLDSAGEPVTGTVTLQLELFSAASGGSPLWTETHSSVSVTDGIYDVVLGSLTPLTPAHFSASPRYLQVTIDGQVLSPRREFVAVPFALQAENANTATTASNAQNVGGVSADFVGQSYQYGDFDGNGLANAHAAEGLADADGDGVANFVDADNDSDGLGDAIEVGQGSNPNLVTPTIGSFSPANLLEQASATVTVTGTNFDEPGLAVVFGSQTPTPTNLTPTSFQVSVGPQSAAAATVVVSLGNGESDQGSFVFRRRVTAFVTSTTYNGILGGLEGADAQCQARATAGGLAGTFFAWIIAGGENTRTTNQWPAEAVFDLVNGVQFASNFNTLFNSTVHTPPLALDELGSPVSGRAWTGMFMSSCEDWTSAAAGTGGSTGAVNLNGWNWKQGGGEQLCNTSQHLYCFEQ
ncbi:MAG: IPT/TIG domain-containing protein [Candidatus Limnocylindria bacterium]|jgi:hypothetical protein